MDLTSIPWSNRWTYRVFIVAITPPGQAQGVEDRGGVVVPELFGARQRDHVSHFRPRHAPVRVPRRLGKSRALYTQGSTVYRGERERERDQAPLTLRAARPYAVGYMGVCDQEGGLIECPTRQRLGVPR